jgi:hypothetical protein
MFKRLLQHGKLILFGMRLHKLFAKVSALSFDITRKRVTYLLARLVCASHVTHASEPTFSLCLPMGHASHGPPFAPVNSTSHKHWLIDVEADAIVFVFSGHDTQGSVLMLDLYVPVEHATQLPSCVPVYPALQVTSADTVVSIIAEQNKKTSTHKMIMCLCMFGLGDDISLSDSTHILHFSVAQYFLDML